MDAALAPRDACSSSWEPPIDIDGGQVEEMAPDNNPGPSCPTRTFAGEQGGGNSKEGLGALQHGGPDPGLQQGLGPST